ncbi:Transmembrane 4 L6 family member 18, partial [Ophiophagus hannah]
MGLQKCSGCLSCLLIPLALWSIVINILLYFPDGKSSYASSNNHTNYVWHFEGICFSGIMILILAAFLVILDRDTFFECFQSENCTRTYRRFISVVLSLLGIAFSGYSLIVSALSLVQGPYCKTSAGWEYAFKNTAGSGLQILICLLKIISELRQILCGNYPIFVQ